VDFGAERGRCIVERVAVTVPLNPFMSLRALSGYSGLSVRSLRSYLAGRVPLPHYRVGGKLLVRRSEFDSWMVRFRVDRAAEIENIVNEVVSELGIEQVRR
jgi:hypothetical protein